MQDELELLKKDWQKQSEALPRLTAEDIDPMLHKKSSSIVKWIFIISLIEFAFWIIATVFLRDIDLQKINIEEFKFSESLMAFDKYFTILHFSILVGFIIWFYNDFKKINAVDSSKKLIQNILRTRKTVQYYIYTSLILFVIALFATTKFLVDSNPQIFDSINSSILYVVLVLIVLVFIFLFWLLYRVIYVRLMRKLTDNYKELKKLEV